MNLPWPVCPVCVSAKYISLIPQIKVVFAEILIFRRGLDVKSLQFHSCGQKFNMNRMEKVDKNSVGCFQSWMREAKIKTYGHGFTDGLCISQSRGPKPENPTPKQPNSAALQKQLSQALRSYLTSDMRTCRISCTWLRVAPGKIPPNTFTANSPPPACCLA